MANCTPFNATTRAASKRLNSNAISLKSISIGVTKAGLYRFRSKKVFISVPLICNPKLTGPGPLDKSADNQFIALVA